MLLARMRTQGVQSSSINGSSKLSKTSCPSGVKNLTVSLGVWSRLEGLTFPHELAQGQRLHNS